MVTAHHVFETALGAWLELAYANGTYRLVPVRDVEQGHAVALFLESCCERDANVP